MDTHVKIASLLSKTESNCCEFYLFLNSYSKFCITGPQFHGCLFPQATSWLINEQNNITLQITAFYFNSSLQNIPFPVESYKYILFT